MPWYDGNVPALWKAALEKKTSAKIAVKAILDPSSRALTLDGDTDITALSDIVQETELDLTAGGVAYVQDVTAEFNDLGNDFAPDNSASLFHKCEATLSAAAVASATTIKLVSWAEVSFAADEVLEISDATNSEQVTVALFSADNGSTGYHELYIDAPGLVNSYAAGSRIYTLPAAGKELFISLDNLTAATDQEIPIYRGKLTRDPDTSAGKAVLNLADSRKEQLDSALIGADSSSTLKLMCIGADGTLYNSIAWDNDFYQLPLTYSIVAGALPAGVELDSSSGTLSGTPTTAETATFTLRVTNADGDYKDQDCTLIIYDRINEDMDSALGLDDFTASISANNEFGWELETPTLATTEGYCRLASDGADEYYWYPDDSYDNYNILEVASPGTLTGDFCLLANIDGTGMNTTVDFYMGLIVAVGGTGDYDFGYILGYHKVSTVIKARHVNDNNTIGSVTGLTAGLHKMRIRKVSGTFYFDYSTATGSWTNLGNVAGEGAKTVKKIGIGAAIGTGSKAATTSHIDVDYFRAYYGALAVATAALPASKAGYYYNYKLRATGGAGEYTWDVSVGSLPAGLSLNASTGAITGHQTANGTTNFTVRVTDGAGTTATQALSIVAADGNELLPDIYTPGDKNVDYEAFTSLFVGGMLDREQVTIGSRCPVGQWVFKWNSTTAFTATPPGLTPTDGDITVEFAIGNIITIPASAWTSGMQQGDEMTFVTGITYASYNPVSCIFDLLANRLGIAHKYIDASSFFSTAGFVVGNLYETANAGASTFKIATDCYLPSRDTYQPVTLNDGVHTEDHILVKRTMANSYPPYVTVTIFITTLANTYGTGTTVTFKRITSADTTNAYSFDEEYLFCESSGIRVSMTLDREMSVAQAIETIGGHAMLIQYQSLGLEKLHCMRPRTQSAYHEFTEADIKHNVSMETLEMINLITVYYAYDHTTQKFLKSYTYPETSAENPSYRKHGKEVGIDLYAPGFYNDDQAQSLARRRFEQYADGMQMVGINCDFRSIVMRIGEQWDIDIDDPDIDGRFETYKKTVSAMAPRNVALWGYNTKLYDKFAMPDAAMADVSCTW